MRVLTFVGGVLIPFPSRELNLGIQIKPKIGGPQGKIAAGIKNSLQKYSLTQSEI